MSIEGSVGNGFLARVRKDKRERCSRGDDDSGFGDWKLFPIHSCGHLFEVFVERA